MAAVPEGASASNVTTAKQALKPDFVQSLERGRKGKQSKRHRRKNDVFIRQGEWFFISAPNAHISAKLVLLNEPISRGRGSKPHICEFLYRDGGVTVYVCGRYPNGLVEAEYKKVLKDTRAAKKWNWQVMKRDPVVFVRGKISHPDHATINLGVWHRVEMNTENKSRAMAQVAFLD